MIKIMKDTVIEDMRAEDIYANAVNIIKSMSQDEIDIICQSILNAPGDRAAIIYFARKDGWWNQDDETTCQSILEAPGDRAWVILQAKLEEWWFQNNEDTCKSILEAPGNRTSISSFAKQAGWWVEPKDSSIIQ